MHNLKKKSPNSRALHIKKVFLFWIFMRVTRQMYINNMDRICSDYGINYVQSTILTNLKYSNNSVRITDLAHYLNQNINNVSMFIDRMEKKGLVRRVKSNKDRRAVIVQLTDVGDAIADDSLPSLYLSMEKDISSFSDSNLDNILELLEKLTMYLSEQLPKEKPQIVPFDLDLIADFLINQIDIPRTKKRYEVKCRKT